MVEAVMDAEEGAVWPLVTTFAGLSLLSVGGGISALLPEIHRQVVEGHGWISNAQFTDLYAISKAAPGPGVLLVPLIGFEVSGLTGAIAAIVAYLTPASVVSYCAARLWHRFRDAGWRTVVQAGLVPISLGLVAASSWLITLSSDISPGTFLVTGMTLVVTLFTRIHPLVPLAVGAVLGSSGLI
jgi:chromate transporter